VTRISLRGLPVEVVHHELASISGHAVPVAVSARVHALTGGNPLFVSELGRLLADDVAAGKPIDDTWPNEVPATVRALIRRRLGRLSPSTQDVLRAAAVVGREFAVAVVAAMVRAPAMACLAALDDADTAGLVEPSGVPGRQRFVHALIRDAVEADLASTEQVRLHRAAADALEAAVDRDVRPSAIAWHRAAAELAAPTDERDPTERLRAVEWARRAADEAMHRLAWEEAARLRRPDRVDELREPLASAQLQRFRAILASTRGRFADALEIAERGQSVFLRTGQAIAAAQHAGFRCSVGRFAGYPPDLADALAVSPDASGRFAGMGRVRSALVLAALGRTSEAAAEYRRLDPVTSWRLTGYLQLTAWALRLRVAVALRLLDDVAALVELLAPHRGLHAGGGLSYDGPIELAIGAGAAALGQLDSAEDHLTKTLDWSRAQDAPPFLVESAWSWPDRRDACPVGAHGRKPRAAHPHQAAPHQPHPGRGLDCDTADAPG
jgi:hypothetical protein